MAGAASYRGRQGWPQPGAFDPDDLTRRLKIVANEQKIRELERRRSHWEASLLQARHEQQPDHNHNPSESAPREDSHDRRVSLALSPTQLPPALDDRPPPTEPARKNSQPFEMWPQGGYVPQYAATSMLSTTTPHQPSVEVDPERLQRDSAPDLETIEEVAHDGKQNLHSEWTLADRQRNQSGILVRNDNGYAPDFAVIERQTRAQAQHKSWRPSSIMGKVGHYWRIQSSDTTGVDDRQVFHSDASTLRNSWRSSKGSLTAPTLRRRSSILKRVDGHWIVSPLPQNKEAAVKEIPPQGDEPIVETSKAQKLTSFFSKLKI